MNFLLMYMVNPNEAAKMPAYRTRLPRTLAECLKMNPSGCPYTDFAEAFEEREFNGDRSCALPPDCRTHPEYLQFAPSVAQHPKQINEPLGLDRADEIARGLGVKKSMILTDREYQCTLGEPGDRNPTQELIVACLANLTNSTGNTNIPLSSYGLAIADPPPGAEAKAGDAQSLCAPAAPCLEFNSLFGGPLEDLAISCGWEMKLDQLTLPDNTPLVEFVMQGDACQVLGGSDSGGPCIVEPVCRPPR